MNTASKNENGDFQLIKSFVLERYENPTTISDYLRPLKKLIKYLQQEKNKSIKEYQAQDLLDFFDWQQNLDSPPAVRTKNVQVAVFGEFFEWLEINHKIKNNSEILASKIEKSHDREVIVLQRNSKKNSRMLFYLRIRTKHEFRYFSYF